MHKPNKPTNSRLFDNAFLEWLSHTHPMVPLLLWLPVAGALLYRAFFVHHLATLPLLAIGLAALLMWSLTEYLMHRFLFHFKGQSRLSKRLVFMFHGIHHDAPQVKTRLVMPPAPALLFLIVFWGLFSTCIPGPWIEPFMAFFIMGYLIYDYIHYATHHFRMRSKVGRFLKRYHMQHHFSRPNAHYGVSSPLWDKIFKTY